MTIYLAEAAECEGFVDTISNPWQALVGIALLMCIAFCVWCFTR